MFKRKYHIALSYDEYKMIIDILVCRKNQMHQEGRYTDCLDELLLKMLNNRSVQVRIA